MFMQPMRRALVAWLVCVPVCHVHALEAPKGKVVLTISGKVSQRNQGSDAVFSMEMLQRLPQRSFTTKTPWYPKAVTFTGPLLRDVLAAAGASGSQITARALDDYKTTLPLSDPKNFDVILAHQIDGKTLTVRDKGPLFIVYPFDSKPALQAQVYLDRSAWQLKSLTIE